MGNILWTLSNWRPSKELTKKVYNRKLKSENMAITFRLAIFTVSCLLAGALAGPRYMGGRAAEPYKRSAEPLGPMLKGSLMDQMALEFKRSADPSPDREHATPLHTAVKRASVVDDTQEKRAAVIHITKRAPRWNGWWRVMFILQAFSLVGVLIKNSNPNFKTKVEIPNILLQK